MGADGARLRWPWLRGLAVAAPERLHRSRLRGLTRAETGTEYGTGTPVPRPSPATPMAERQSMADAIRHSGEMFWCEALHMFWCEALHSAVSSLEA
jgi:hypothetical protein